MECYRKGKEKEWKGRSEKEDIRREGRGREEKGWEEREWKGMGRTGKEGEGVCQIEKAILVQKKI